MCNCIQIKEIPSLFCSICGEIQCIICSDSYYKCSSCSSFSCKNCNINLLCNHNYCSVECVLKNEKSICNNYCFFLRDVHATGNDEQGLKNLIYYWEKKNSKNLLKIWTKLWIESNNENEKDFYEKIVQITKLL